MIRDTELDKLFAPSPPTHFQRWIEISLIDAALVTSAVALVILGVLSRHYSTWLSYGMYGAATLCALAETVKLLVSCCINELPTVSDPKRPHLKPNIDSKIRSIIIEDQCYKTIPCKHDCEITLANGKKIKTGLTMESAGALIHAVHSSKAKFKADTNYIDAHFSYVADEKLENAFFLTSEERKGVEHIFNAILKE